MKCPEHQRDVEAVEASLAALNPQRPVDEGQNPEWQKVAAQATVSFVAQLLGE